MSMFAAQALESDGVDSYTFSIIAGRYVISIGKGGMTGIGTASSEGEAYELATAALA